MRFPSANQAGEPPDIQNLGAASLLTSLRKIPLLLAVRAVTAIQLPSGESTALPAL